MGLLDDAIREHLELKRRHGADPDEVARQEREAFGPGQRNEFAQPADVDAPPAAEPATTVLPEDEAPAAAEPQPDEDALPAGEPGVPEEPTAEHPAAAPGYDEDPWLEEDEAEPPAEQPAAEEEDVLEETPEFLQETPEHDRLWFEQKPPRDFDWDK